MDADCADIGLYFKKISEALEKKINAEVRNLGLTLSQCRVLMYLKQSDGTAPLKEIENYLGVTHATASGIISRLAGKGFVRSAAAMSDKRAKTVELTEKSGRLFGKALAFRNELETALAHRMTERQRRQFIENLKIIYENINGSKTC